MSASSKNTSSSSLDKPTYANGQRGPYVAASLEKSGCFRECSENRIPSSLASMSRPGSTSSQGDMNNLVHSLLSDLKPVVLDQKFLRPLELKRSMRSAIGVSSEDSIPTSFSTKPLPSSLLEEIRHIRSNLNELSTKARYRTKAFGDATSKIDNYSHSLSRNRSQADISPSGRSNVLLPGGSVPRTGPQSHLTASDPENWPQKLEGRANTAIPNRRSRTGFRVEIPMNVRANAITKPSGPVERDKDVSELINGGATPSKEKGQAVPTVVDGWDLKIKKKRSVIKSDVSATAALARPLDCDREPKRGMQQKLISDARPRLNNTHGFRSGAIIAATGVGKSDSTSQQNGLRMCLVHRNDQENDSLPSDIKDHPVGSDTDGSTLKAANKPNCIEYNCFGSPTATVKLNASARGPRSNLALMASPNIHQTWGNSDEHPQCVNKLNAAVGAISRKQSTSTCSPSHPVAKCVGRQPQKKIRVARRSRLIPVVLGHEFSALDRVDNADINDNGLAITRRLASNASQHSQFKGDHVALYGLSESEESEAANNKSEGNSKICSEIEEERAGPTVQKVATLVLPSRKKKMSVLEDLGDGIRWQRRNRSGFGSTRSGVPAATENLDNAQAMGTARTSSEKIESKPGRPPTKKWSERRGNTRPGHSMNNEPREFSGQLDDDHEELLAAAIAVLDTRHACSISFWKQIEPVFGYPSAENLALLEQIHVMEEAAVSTCVSGDGQNVKGHDGFVKLPSTPAVVSRDDCDALSNGISVDERNRDIGLTSQTEEIELFLEQLIQGNEAPNGISYCQLLLSAIIKEDEIGNFNYTCDKGKHLYEDAHGNLSEFDAEFKSKGSNPLLSGTFQAPEIAPSNGYRIHSDIEGDALDELSPNRTTTCNSVCTEFQYNQMCLNDRILLELSEIGLYPDPMPDLAQCEEEDICKDIHLLQEKLYGQVMKKKSLLSKLGKAVMEAREHQQRELERIALDKLVVMAYEKYLASWGRSASGSKNVNKSTKHAALGFAQRTLARYQKFVETGSNCFSKPAFRNMFRSAIFHNNGAECIDIAANGEATNGLTATLHTSTDYKTSLASQSAEKIHKVRKRELLLDNVVGATGGTSLRAPSGLGSSLVCGRKGKRSKRTREGNGQNRDETSTNGNPKIGRPALSNGKGKRTSRTKRKQKTAELSASVIGVLNMSTDIPNTILSSSPKSHEMVVGGITKKDSGVLSSHVGIQDNSNDADAIDSSNLQLPEIDDDFNSNGQDMLSGLNIDEDGLQDHDYIGLGIPMDDLSGIKVMI